MPPRRKAQRKRKSTPETTQGWVWGLFGLGVGLSVAALSYLTGRQPMSPPPAIDTPPATSVPAPTTSVQETENQPAKNPRFTFYDMLPNFEVVIPEEDADVIRAAPLETIDKPGVYVLQAGSFSTYGDADGRKAQLALLGVQSAIQKVAVDDKVYHRVRVGPIDNVEQLNETRQQLRGAKIDVMVIRVGE